MILNRLENQGKIKEEFKLPSFQKSSNKQRDLFEVNL